MVERILSVKSLSAWLKSDKSQILNDISFDLYAGDVLAIDGFNGSGKSTLLRLICGETSDYKAQGEVIYYPFSTENLLAFSEKQILAYRSSIGYVPQKDNYDGLNKVTIQDLIMDACKASGFDSSKAMTNFNDFFGNSKRIKLKSVPGKLSGGEQRMVSIFLGLACKTKSRLMIVDEPLNNLDFENAMRVSDMLNKIRLENPSSGMILITHCKVITCVNRQRRLVKGRMEKSDSKYECHHCMGEPNEKLYYFRHGNLDKN